MYEPLLMNNTLGKPRRFQRSWTVSSAIKRTICLQWLEEVLASSKRVRDLFSKRQLAGVQQVQLQTPQYIMPCAFALLVALGHR